MNLSLAALLLGTAVLAAGGRCGAARLRMLAASPGAAADAPAIRPLWVAVGGAATGALAWVVTGSPTTAALSGAAGVGAGLLAHRFGTRLPGRRDDDPADLATAWTQLAVCLEVGLPVALAVAAAAAPLTGRSGDELRRVAGLLELGADPEQAWQSAGRSPVLGTFARAARRSAATGAGLARAAHAEAARLQGALVDAAEARAQRAAVLITAPLGLCFLPAFLVLGIAPVVIGLADDALRGW